MSTDPQSASDAPAPSPPPEEPRDWRSRARQFLIGPPRSVREKGLFAHLSLIPFLAWVGLGADGLSSSSYGPEESFKALQGHTYLAVGLAILTAATVFLISSAYSRIIEKFPHGGGGYVVATKLLGPRTGLVSGCALLVDYVLTITVSVAAAGNALRDIFGIPPAWVVPLDVGLVLLLMLLNLRGVRESVVALTPIFLLFVLTHAILILGGIALHVGEAGARAASLEADFREGLSDSSLGGLGMLLLFMRAFSLGGGTYTGIEAVSNSMPILREPRVQTAKATMRYMAWSLAFVASGLILCYLLWDIRPAAGDHPKTMNTLLAERFAEGMPLAKTFVFVTIFTEAALLLVAAQAGFLAGPRTLANLAVDSWAPRRFAALSERLTTENGVVMMALASIGALLYAAYGGGEDSTEHLISRLVTMYSINVFATFALSMLGMVFYWRRTPPDRPNRRARLALFITGTIVCATILVVTVVEKFLDGGWVTIVVTGACVVVCLVTRRHYVSVADKLQALYSDLANLPLPEEGVTHPPDPAEPTAVVLVSGYGGLGIHTVLNVFRSFPGHFKNLVFVSVGVIDSGAFKGETAVEGLDRRTQTMLAKYVELGRRLGLPTTFRSAIGTDAVETAEDLCRAVAREFPRSTFFAGKVIFKEEGFFQRMLHNETAVALQKRLHFGGMTMVILPARVY